MTFFDVQMSPLSTNATANAEDTYVYTTELSPSSQSMFVGHWHTILLMAMRLRCVSFLIASQAFGFSPFVRRQVKQVQHILPAIRGGSFQTRMTSKTVEDDKYAWLEDVEAKECLDFAKFSNDKCIKL